MEGRQSYIRSFIPYDLGATFILRYRTMSDQETRDKRKAAYDLKFGKKATTRRKYSDRYKQTDDQRFDRRSEYEDHWDRTDDVFHDPTDGELRELNFDDDDYEAHDE